MKKSIFLILVCLFAFVAVQAQSGTTDHYPLSAITASVAGGTGTSTLPIISGELDVSIQLIPALFGAGDSVDYTYILYQSNENTGDIWSILQTTKTVTTVDDADALSNLTDFKGVRIKAICTVTTDDTVTITPYISIKKHANE